MRKFRFKEWDEMAELYGVSSLGNIETKRRFLKSMKPLCGKEFEFMGVDDYGDLVICQDERRRMKEICGLGLNLSNRKIGIQSVHISKMPTLKDLSNKTNKKEEEMNNMENLALAGEINFYEVIDGKLISRTMIAKVTEFSKDLRTVNLSKGTIIENVQSFKFVGESEFRFKYENPTLITSDTRFEWLKADMKVKELNVMKNIGLLEDTHEGFMAELANLIKERDKYSESVEYKIVWDDLENDILNTLE